MRARKPTFFQQVLVDLPDVCKVILPLKGNTPILNMTQNTVLDFMIEGWDFEDGDEVVDKLARSNFCQELVSPVLDADVCQLCNSQ